MKMFAIVLSVTTTLCGAVMPSSHAQSGSTSNEIKIESRDLPVEERSLLESLSYRDGCEPSDLQSQIADRVRALGYFKAIVSPPKAVAPRRDQDGHSVNIFSVRAGTRYYLSDVEFQGTHALSQEALRRAILISPGQVFSAPLVGQGLAEVRQLYASVGRQSAVITPTLTFKETEHTVILTLFVRED